MTDLVSIIMLSRNRVWFVEDSVRSVLAQTYTNWNYCSWMNTTYYSSKKYIIPGHHECNI